MIVSNNIPPSSAKPDTDTMIYPARIRPVWFSDSETVPLLASVPPPYRPRTPRLSPSTPVEKPLLRSLLHTVIVCGGLFVVVGTTFLCTVGSGASRTILDENNIPRTPMAPDSATTAPVGIDGEVVKCHLPSLPYYQAIYTAAEDPINNGTSELNYVDDTWVADNRLPFAAVTTFELPAEASLLYFLSRIGISRGTVRVAPAVDDASVVRGEIIVRYSTLEERDGVNICILRRNDRAYGVGIYTTKGDSTQRWARLRFDVSIVLPTTKAPERGLYSFETNLPRFSHHFDDFSNAPLGDVNLVSHLAPIVAKGLNAHSITARTTSAPISGEFHVRKSLELATSDAYMKAKVYAANDDWQDPAYVTLTTSNSRIETEVSLESSATSKKHSTEIGLRLEAVTSNGSLNITVPSAPSSSHLSINAATTHADAYTALPPTFEGRVHLYDRNGRIRVSNNVDAVDPSGEGRKRKYVPKRRDGQSVLGLIHWCEESEYRERSAAVVTTTNGDNLINFF